MLPVKRFLLSCGKFPLRPKSTKSHTQHLIVVLSTAKPNDSFIRPQSILVGSTPPKSEATRRCHLWAILIAHKYQRHSHNRVSCSSFSGGLWDSSLAINIIPDLPSMSLSLHIAIQILLISIPYLIPNYRSSAPTTKCLNRRPVKHQQRQKKKHQQQLKITILRVLKTTLRHHLLATAEAENCAPPQYAFYVRRKTVGN